MLFGKFYQSLAILSVSILEVPGRTGPAVGNADYPLPDTLKTTAHGPDQSGTDEDKAQA